MRNRTAQLRAENEALRTQLRALQKEKDEHFASSKPDDIPSPDSLTTAAWPVAFSVDHARVYYSVPDPTDIGWLFPSLSGAGPIDPPNIGTSPIRVICDELAPIIEN